MSPLRSPRVRSLLPVVAAIALTVLAAFAVQSVRDRDAASELAMRSELEERLSERILAWEQDLLLALGEIAQQGQRPGVDHDVLEARLKRQHPWLDALYVWEIEDESPLIEGMASPPPMAVFDHPRAPDPAFHDHSNADDTLVAHLADRVLAAEQDANQGDLELATAQRLALVRSVVELDAAHLEQTLYVVPTLLDQIREAGTNTEALESRLDAAERRLAAYREVAQWAARPQGLRGAEVPRLTHDQYSDLPYLLYLTRFDDGRRGLALQLDQDQLVQSFLRERSSFEGQLAVRDASGRWVAGARGASTNGVRASFSETIRHLEILLTDEGLAARLDPSTRRGSIVVLGLIWFCLALGIFALWGQYRAGQRHQVLLQRQRDFVARVTHELKTPLAGMRLMAENLADGVFRDADHRESLARRIIDEADRLTERVEEILAIGSRRELADPEPVDLEEVVFTLLESWGPRYEQHGVKLAVDTAPVDTILGDHAALRDAIGCLLDNALKYRRDDVDSEVHLDVHEQGRELIVEVTDNGLGVPKDQRADIFERFVRVEGPNRGKSGGHGLGLSQVASIVERHHGRVSCTDGLDGGARFTIRLPLPASASELS